MPSVGFEPTISEDERPQTYALDRAATGTGRHVDWIKKKTVVTNHLQKEIIISLKVLMNAVTKVVVAGRFMFFLPCSNTQILIPRLSTDTTKTL